jgi:hypothetical protein
MALMIGDRFFGWRGAFASLVGLLAAAGDRDDLAALCAGYQPWYPARCAAWVPPRA